MDNKFDKLFNMMEKMYVEFSGKFDKMDDRFDKMDDRFDKMDDRFDKMDDRFDKMDDRFDKMDDRFDKMDDRFDKMDGRIDGMESKMATKDDIKDINRKLEVLENKLDNNCKALYDGYMMNSEKLTVVVMKVDELNRKVENQDLEIRVVKNVIKH
ncbi:hypothetical protein QUF55_03500 [Clostridiaceae bacterium HSG29]|nr:hypothetical protein [Clostridiaceae bacterium HSG29]